MKRISLIFAAALALAGFSAKAEEDTLTMDKFAYTNALMVSGYTGTETLENFPVLVRLDNIDGFQYSNMSDPSYGRDLAFFDADGNHIASEIDTWRDSNSKKSLVWVKLPEMAQGTKFFVCYNPSASGVMVTNANPWTDYVGVWHLGESGNAGTAISDSTTNHLDGTAAADNGEGVNGSNGAIGRARRIAKNNYHAAGIIIDATNGVKNAVADSLGTDFHASFWMRAQDKVEYSYLIGRRRGDNGASWGVQFVNGNPPSKVRIFSGGVLGQNSDNDCVLTADGVGTILSEQTSNPRTWKKVDVIWKDATNGGTPAYDFYINGEFVESKNLKMAVNTNEHANIGIGCSTQDVYANADKGDAVKKGRRLNGDMDEVRLRPGIVSADWIKADFDTVNNASFLIVPKTVTWDVGTNGGTMDVGGTTVTTTTNTIPLDFVPSAPGTPVKAGAVFLGWSTIPTATTVVDPAGFVASSPLTFYAIFADAAVRWFAADGTTPLDPAVTAVAAGSSPAHADPPAPPSTLHDRYVFDGWTRVDGDGSTVYQTAELPIVSAGDDISYKVVSHMEHSDDPDPSLLGFSHFAALKVAGYTGSAPVANFPVLVRLSETTVSGFLYSDLASPSDGADLAFFDAGGNPLAFEIDTWNPSGESLVWVRLPSMQNGTRIMIWWGSSEVTGKSVCTGDPWSDYTGVWHMNETGNGSSVVVHDATINRLDGSSPNSSAAVAAGPVGGARFVTSYQDNTSSYNSGFVVDLSSDAAKRAAVDAIVPEFSASMWIRPRNTSIKQSQFEYLISRRAADKGPGWGAQFDEKSNRFSPLRVYSNEETDKADDGRGNPANVKVSTGASTGIAYQEWHKVDLAWTADGKYRIFVDGVQTSKDSTSTLVGGPVTNCLAATLPLCLGGSAAPLASGDSSGRGLYGDMDEVRLRPGALSPDRALADFETVTNRDFLVNDILTIAWSDASGTSGFVRIGARTAVIGGAVSIFGLADSCDVEGKIWAAGDAEPADWTILTNGIDSLAAFFVPVAGLTAGTTYHYALRAVGNDGEVSKTVSGSFTTLLGLTVAWTSATASAGLSKIAPDFVTASGSISSLGDATACAIQAKVWMAGDSEPGSWTTVAENLALNASFNATIRETSAGDAIAPGTAYAYALRAVGNDAEETDPVTGMFTTGGEPGETIGSDYTKFFDDGTNACWVVKGFERYLPFTVTGYTGTETLTNFPVLVDVRDTDTNGFRYSDFYHYDGSDMAFVDDTGHIIPHEIDTWNKNGMSLIWVRLPRMNNGTTFTMCYRSPLIDPLPDVGNTFEKYVGVWHMNETQNGVASIKDSTANNIPGESHAKSLAGINQGQMIGGNARRVAQESGTSSSNGRIMVYDHDGILRTSVGNVFTYSGWYKTADAKPNWAYLVARKGDDYSKGWGIQYTDDNAADKLRVWSDPQGNKGLHQDGKAGGYYHFGITNYCTGAAVGYNHGDWAYWTFVFSNNTFHAFHNGTELESTVGGFTLEQPFANDDTADYDFLVIGGMEFGTGAFNGFVDEARYSKGIRSDDWIKAEYDSTRQKDVAFVTKGTVGIGHDSPVPVVVWEKGTDLPLSIIDVSYAYVQFAGTVTYCGKGADDCRVEYQIWADGEEDPTIDGVWTSLGNLTNATAGTSFSVPVTGLKQDMPYNFRIRAVNTLESGEEQANREQTGSFHTLGNLAGSGGGELMRIDNRFVHRYRAGSYTFTTPDYVTSVEILVVGGGGAGGYKIGGGGGGGGLFYSESFPVETNTTYRIQVGEGGNAASDLSARGGNGQLSYFARKDGDNEEDDPILISVPGGGAGGSYINNNAAIATGADGGSGGGGTFALAGGQPVSNEVDGVWVTYGYEGGQGNDSKTGGNKDGKTAAGGGGGAAREGVTASFDSYYGGGAGGAGLSNSMTGEQLFYGAGGGGGYAYKEDQKGYSKPGAGGSGIGGNAADVRNVTPATSGVENTGAGGGGGSMILNNQTDQTYWKGGNGGDGVVLIAYEVHGRDPISEEPQIAMTSLDFTDERGYATIGYRAYWAGIQADTSDIYVLYSTVSEEDVRAGNGEMVKCAEGTIGIGSLKFTPPEMGYTYWVRLVARKDANSFMYSDEVASFEVPAIRINGVTWTAGTKTYKGQTVPDTTKDKAQVLCNIYDKTIENPRLYCYWSENRADLEGNSEPTGEGVRFLNVTTNLVDNFSDNSNKILVNATRFNVAASLGLERGKTYYFRLALSNEAGSKFLLSPRIMQLDTVEKPYVVFPEAWWDNYIATIDVMLFTADYDPSQVDLLALYGTQEGVSAGKPIEHPSISAINLGTCDLYPRAEQTLTQFALSSTVATNYFLKLALRLPDNSYVYSARFQEIDLDPHLPTNTILICARAIPKKGCYGDELPTFEYTVDYQGYTNTVAWDNKPNVVGALKCVTISDEPSEQYPVTAQSPSGQYRIIEDNLKLSNPAPYNDVVTKQILDPTTGEEQTVTETTTYYYMFAYARSRYTITNAVFTTSIADVSALYTGDAFSLDALHPVESGVRNNQTVSYLFRSGEGEWSDEISASYTDVGLHPFEFKASAPSHDDVYDFFTVTIKPAPLTATIGDVSLNYNGAAQTPEVVTNVTGLMRGDINPLTCDFRDEAGEWQATVPSFTNPGKYKLFFRAMAPNHATSIATGIVTIVGWDYKVNMDGANGYATDIHVSDPGWLLRNTTYTSEDFSVPSDRYGYLDAVCPNGLKLWQNYVIDRKNMSQRLVATIMQRGSRVGKDAFVVHFPGVEALHNTGLNIRFRLDKKLKGESEFTRGELSDKYEMSVPLGFEDGNDSTGLYVFNMVLVSTNETAETGAGEAVLASCATVGVMRVACANPNTVAAVPWKSMSVDTEEERDIPAGEVVNQNGLSIDDMIVAYNAASKNFSGWTNEGEDGWKGLATVTKNGVSLVDAETAQMPRGNAFWLVRSAPSKYFYLIGRYTGEDYDVELAGGTVKEPGHTLVANPTTDDTTLGALKFYDGNGVETTPGDGDRIVILDASGFEVSHYRSGGKWVHRELQQIGKRTKQVQVDSSGVVIPAGTGFWYTRKSEGALVIKFGGAE